MTLRAAACALLAAAASCAPAGALDARGVDPRGASSAGPAEIGKLRVNGPTPATATLLAPGQTLLDYSPSYTSMYYVYEANADQNTRLATFGTLTIAVSPIAGNPNVFVGIGTFTNANLYNSTSNQGIDFIQIGNNDTVLNTYCAPSWGTQIPVPPVPCLIYIRVTGGPQQINNPSGTGTRSTNYSISLSSSTSGSALVNNVPYIGVVAPGSASQGFTFTVATLPQDPTLQAVTFVVTPLVGFGSRSTPILAVSLTNSNPAYQSNVTCAVGNSGLSGREVVALNPANAAAGCWCSTPPCVYYLSITPQPGQVFAQQFALTASTSASPNVTLIDGVETTYDGASSAAGTTPTPLFIFNAIWDVQTARAVRIIESPIVGAVNLYATLDGSIPTNNNFQYSATRFSGQNELVVRITDPAVAMYCAAALGNANVTCPIFISAVTISQRSSFLLEARQSAVYRLSPAVPVTDYVFPNQVTYYYVQDVNYGGTFEVTLTALSNQFVDIYVGSDAYPGMQLPNPNVTGSFCKSTQASTTQSGFIAIPPTDGCFCNVTTAQTCNYYIGVAARYNASADYVILAKYTGGFQLLVSGGLAHATLPFSRSASLQRRAASHRTAHALTLHSSFSSPAASERALHGRASQRPRTSRVQRLLRLLPRGVQPHGRHARRQLDAERGHTGWGGVHQAWRQHLRAGIQRDGRVQLHHAHHQRRV